MRYRLLAVFATCALGLTPACGSEQSDLVERILNGRQRTNAGMDDAKVKPAAPAPEAPTIKLPPLQPDKVIPGQPGAPAAKGTNEKDAGNADPMSCMWLEQSGKKWPDPYYKAWLNSSCPYAATAMVEECDTDGKGVACREVAYTMYRPGRYTPQISSMRREPVIKSAAPKPPKPKRN